ncbi:MAG: helix-turn-helix domain-containing protein [Hyphomicrobium sp.]|uniref:helix-turn-helix domain-containing protein n=1 Tax=Hyphomicrobium sp. TaxID=82 RepID=UPI003D10ED4E
MARQGEGATPTAESNDAAAGEAAHRVGLEIRQLRKAKEMTIAELSLATGLSAGYLSQIERGISSPSVKALHTLSRALGVTVSFFFSPETDDGGALRDLVVRAGQRRTLTFENDIRDELLSPNLGRKLELLRSVFPPGSSSGAEPYVHRGEEAGFVVSGELRLWVGEQEVLLKEGDSFAYSSDLPHRYANPGTVETVVIWAITPPSY